MNQAVYSFRRRTGHNPEESFFCRIFQNKPAIISNDIFRHTAHTMDAAQRRLKIK
jgi:hypothetical protein